MKTKFLGKLKDYLKNSSGNNVSLKIFKGYSLNIFYKYRYNNFFSINLDWIHNTYYNILNEFFPQNWIEYGIIILSIFNYYKYKYTKKINF